MNYEIPQKLQIQPCAIKGERRSLMGKERTFWAWLASMSVGGGYSKMVTNRQDIILKIINTFAKLMIFTRRFFYVLTNTKYW